MCILLLFFLSFDSQASQDEAAAAHTAAARAVQAVDIHKRRIQELENELESKARVQIINTSNIAVVEPLRLSGVPADTNS